MTDTDKRGNAFDLRQPLARAAPDGDDAGAMGGWNGISRRRVVKGVAMSALAGSLSALGGRPPDAAAQDASEGATPVASGQEGPAAPWWKANSPFLKGVMTRPNMEPAIPHPGRDERAAEKLAALASRARRKPNMIVVMVDDMGWGDPGCFGGGPRSARRRRISTGSRRPACA